MSEPKNIQVATKLRDAKLVGATRDEAGIRLENVGGAVFGTILGPKEAFQLLNVSILAAINLPPVKLTSSSTLFEHIELKADQISFLEELGPTEVQIQIFSGGVRLLLSVARQEFLDAMGDFVLRSSAGAERPIQ